MDATEANDANAVAETDRTQAGTAPADIAGTVYLIQGRPGTPIKIGYTSHNDVSGRLASLQTAHPYRLQAIFKFPGSMRDERAIHKVLAPERLHGEWFECSDRFIAFYDRLRTAGLADALEAMAALQTPDAPAGWDKLITTETGAYYALNLDKSDYLSKARKAGTGPPFRAVVNGRNTARYYYLADLARWLVANQIPHRPDHRYWRHYVFDVPEDIADDVADAAELAVTGEGARALI